jgi:pyruvate/2-oxoacid:ferredoxin oxidoreductase beta subunit
MIVFGDYEEFEKGMNALKHSLYLQSDVTVSVFETTIRELGNKRQYITTIHYII